MLEKAEAVAQRCSVKKVFLEISQYLQENICAGVSSLIKLQACNFIKKETPAQVCSCEFREISKNTFSYRKPPVAVSEKGDSSNRQNMDRCPFQQVLRQKFDFAFVLTQENTFP